MARIAIGCLAVLVAWASSAHAHVVYGTPSLYDLVRDADRVVRVRVVEPSRLVHVDGVRRAVVDATVLETLAGPPAARVRFVPHGHGAAEYHRGEEALVFLRRTDRVPELRSTPLAAAVEWASLQETSDEIPLDARTRRPWVEATRRYLAAEAIGDPDARRKALAGATIALLGSPDPRLAASALRHLVAAGDAFPLAPDAVRRLEALVARERVPMAVRAGLLVELERRRLVAGGPYWAAMVDGAQGPDALVVVRAAGAHPGPEVTAALVRRLRDRRPEIAAAAAVSLGASGNSTAVAPLVALLASHDPRLRAAAIRGLGGIGGGDALDALRVAAAFHPDPATRRRAGAQATLLARRAAP